MVYEYVSGDSRQLAISGSVRLFRDGLARLAQGIDGFAVIATRPLNSEALIELANLDLDAILVQILSREESLIVRSALEGWKVRLIGVGIPEVDELIVSCVEAGVSGFVETEGTFQDLINLVEAVAINRPPIPPAVAAALIRQAGSGPDRSRQATLTQREIETFNCLKEGLSNKEIAQQLRIDVSTVKNHVHSIFQKLSVHRRSQAAAIVRTGWQEVARPAGARQPADRSRKPSRSFL